jgi:hypothetical protein
MCDSERQCDEGGRKSLRTRERDSACGEKERGAQMNSRTTTEAGRTSRLSSCNTTPRVIWLAPAQQRTDDPPVLAS